MCQLVLKRHSTYHSSLLFHLQFPPSKGLGKSLLIALYLKTIHLNAFNFVCVWGGTWREDVGCLKGMLGGLTWYLVVEVSRTPPTLLRKGMCGPVQESFLLTPGLVIDVRHKINRMKGTLLLLYSPFLCVFYK